MSQIQEAFLFQPTQISNCGLWLDATDVNGNGTNVANGSSIATWTDKSGNARNATQSTAGYRPTLGSVNGRTSVTFNGISNYLALPDITSVPVTIFMIAAARTNVPNTFFISLGVYPNAIYIREFFSPDMFGVDGGLGFGQYQSGIKDLNTHIWSFGLPASANGFLNFDGSLVATSGFTLSANTSFTPNSIGSWNQRFDNGNINAGISEIIMYNSYLSTSQVQQIEGYLAWKWGLQGSLPASHPFKTYRPLRTGAVPTSIPRMPITNQNTGIFLPTQISGCGLWLDAADTTTFTYSSGSNVSVWTDKSAGIQAQYLTNTMATARAGTNPNGDIGKFGATNYPVSGYNINGVNSLYFNQAILQAIITQSVTTRTYFLVLNIPSPVTSGAILWPATYSGIFAFGGSIQASSTQIIMASQNVANLLFLNYTPNVPFILSITFNNGTTNMWNNGGGTTVPTGQTSSTLGSSDNYLWIGGVSGYYMSPYYMGEFIEYNSALSTSQRQQVEGYLAWKWGLTNSLPSNHPYKQPQLFPLPYRFLYPPTPIVYSSSTWQPIRISGMSLWLDAADPSKVTTSGNNITAITDKSSSALQFTSSPTPPTKSTTLYNKLFGIQFSGSSYLLNSTLSYTLNSRSAFIVCGETTGGNNNGFLSFATTGTDYSQTNAIAYESGYKVTGQYFQIIAAGLTATLTGAINTPTPFAMYVDTFGSGTENVYSNGTLVKNVTTGTTYSNSTGLYVGARMVANTVSNYLTGVICEVILYNSALTTQQRQQVEGYLAWKWGLVGSLPANHPFKLWPPSP